ncbi:MAG: DMT family transporter [Bacillus subtilis]|nr:DMT family transporter [Bacillus subtilis]
MSPLGLISTRFFIAFLAFEALRRFGVVNIRFERSHWKSWLPVALFQPILYFLFETYGLARTSSGEAGMMIAMIPIFVSLLSGMFLMEKPLPIQYFFIALSVGGILFIQSMKQSTGEGSSLLGFSLLFGAVIAAALFNIASRKASQQMKPYETTYFMMLSGALFFTVLYLGELMITNGFETALPNLLRVEFLGPIMYLGIIASIGGFFLVNFALSRLPAHVSSIYSNLSTIVAIIAGALLLDETLAYYHWIGSAMIIIGVYGTVLLNRRSGKNSVK